MYELMTVPEVAEALHCTEATVRKIARTGQLMGKKPGRSWIFARADIVNYISMGYAERVCEGGRHINEGKMSWDCTDVKAEYTGSLLSIEKAANKLERQLKRGTAGRPRRSLKN